MNIFKKIKPFKTKTQLINSMYNILIKSSESYDKDFIKDYFLDKEIWYDYMEEYKNTDNTNIKNSILRSILYLADNYWEEKYNDENLSISQDTVDIILEAISDKEYINLIEYLVDKSIYLDFGNVIHNLMNKINPYDNLKEIFSILKSHTEIKRANGKPWGNIEGGLCVANIPRVSTTSSNKTQYFIDLLDLFEENGGTIEEADYWIIDISLQSGNIEFAKYLVENKNCKIVRPALTKKLLDSFDENYDEYKKIILSKF